MLKLMFGLKEKEEHLREAQREAHIVKTSEPVVLVDAINRALSEGLAAK